MPPALATFLTIAGVLFLLRWEARTAEARSAALWIPVAWMTITGSRFVSQWMDLSARSGNYTDGSPIDAAFFAGLILIAMIVLVRRQVTLGDIVRANIGIAILFGYMMLSILWSDFPFVATKRWIKTLGHPLMALIVLSDPRPAAALRTVLRRCAFFLLPMSVLFIKYLPEYGRGFDAWSGAAYNTGVGLTKNDLGYVCMISGIGFVWMLIEARKIPDRRARRIETALCIAFLYMIGWLLNMAQSATSLVTMLLGIGTIAILGTRLASKRRFGWWVIAVVLTGVVLETSFGIYAQIIEMLGRDPNLPDRTEVWADVLELQRRPVFGYGFESFWLGDRLDVLWAIWWWKPTQAHNGYIETYLNLGLVGLTLLVLVLIGAFRRISRQLNEDLNYSRLRMAFLFAIIFFNYTEATFKAVHLVWTVFHLIAMEPPRRRAAAPGAPVRKGP